MWDQTPYVARVIRSRLDGKAPPSAFGYRDPGLLAILGRSAAAVDFGFVRITGFVGWLVWGFAHIFFLIGFRSRIAVFLEWEFHMRASDLALALKLTEPKSKALRWHLRIDDDNNCIEFGKSTFPCFSDNAKNRMKKALDGAVKMDEVWKAYKVA